MALGENYNDLVDSPNETLSVEYKSWLDLANSNEAKADLARHIAAIANHGGGMILFGFNDDLTVAVPNPGAAASVNRDGISGLIKRYLEPPFHCDVLVVKSATGSLHPTIIVPSHGASPVCAKAGGPELDGKPKGIVSGTYYIRKPGPESERIQTSAEWAPLIRRCALHDRASILSAIEVTMRGAPAQLNEPGRMEELVEWHDAAYAQFKTDCKTSVVPALLPDHNVQFSYFITRADGQRLDPLQLKDTLLLQLNNEVKDRVRTGWSMFYPFTRPEIAARFVVDEKSGERQEDFVETALLRAEERMSYSTDLWRVSTSGKATLIRPYWEDDEEWTKKTKLAPGSTFNPKLHVRAVAELVRHAQAFAEKFDNPMVVTFLTEWQGLAGRSIHDPFGYYSVGGKAVAVGRRTSTEVPVASLETGWPEIVTGLVAPVVRLFNSSFQVSPDYVRGQAPDWLRM